VLPLEGITVVSLEQAVAAPLATRHLADLGARVIKVERPGIGDFARSYDASVNGMASHFVWLNRSKESLTLDLKRTEAQGILRDLLSKCDIFVHNLAPGAVERLGFSLRALRADYPRLIICQISGYGTSGPFRNKKAYDLLIQAETGLLSITGTKSTPAKVGISVADIAAGMYAYSGILAALLMRERTHEGTAIEISLLEALGEWMGFPLYYAAYGAKALTRTGAHHAAVAPYGPFIASDGQIVYLAVQNEREWKQFCEVVLESPALADDDRFMSNSKRVDHREALEQLITEQLGQLTGNELIGRLDRGGIANAPINTIQQFLEHPQLAARRRWRQVDSPVGPVRALIPPVTMENYEPTMGPIPDVGEHTRQILRELAIDEATIEAWHRQGVV
jgi:itaconate CoA-transferase